MKKLGLLALLLLPLMVCSQNASDIIFVNAGGLHVADNSDVSLYVSGGIRMLGKASSVSVIQEGVTKLSGDFYQDSNGPVFEVDASGYGISNGTICFFEPEFGTNLSEKKITSTDLSTFDRASSYVAFPKVLIDMNKNLIVPSQMAVDMDQLLIGNSRTGKLYLKSANDGSTAPGRIYDAALRFPKRTTGETENTSIQTTKAPIGKIVIERSLVGYRANTTAESVMFPFATPFYNTQRSGYFAGNWVRRPVADANHHTRYPYGDEIDPATPGIIARHQYVVDPTEELVPGQAYLIKPLGLDDFDAYPIHFSQFGLQITGAGAPNPDEYKKTGFEFDGNVYHLPAQEEQLNLLPLFDAMVNSRADSTVNILIGNSYTSAIDLKKISQLMIDHPTLFFNRYIYIYSPHRTTPYIAYDAYQHAWGMESPPVLLTEHTVPGMGVFMLRLAKRNASGPIKIDRTFLTHGNNAHNLRSDIEFRDEVLFSLEYESYPQLQDLAAIGFRKGAQEIFETLDMPRFNEEAVEVPILYTLSSDNVALSSNSLPTGVKSVNLCVESGLDKIENCILRISRQESMQTEYLILEDKVTNRFINLYEEDSYSFALDPKDAKDRFVIHFAHAGTLDIDEVESSSLKLFYNKRSNKIDISGLAEADHHSTLIISDLQGRILSKGEVKDSHAVDYLSEGIYIAKIIGERSAVLKFSK